MGYPAYARAWLSNRGILPLAGSDDPVFAFFHHYGWPVELYDLPKVHLNKTNWQLAQLPLCWYGTTFALMQAAKMEPGPSRNVLGAGVLLWVCIFPIVFGKIGFGILDFFLPATSFFGSLGTLELLYCLPREEIMKWSFGRFYVQYAGFPQVPPTGRNPYVVNSLKLIRTIGYFFLVNLVSYSIPTPEGFELVRERSLFRWFLMNGAVGLIILGFLASIVEGLFTFNGLVYGVETKDMFMNPLASTSIREFWSRWNTAIRDKFHHVIFAAMSGVKGSSQSGAVSKDAYQKKEKRSKGPKTVGKDAKGQHRHGDYLSATEAEQSTDAGGYSSSEDKQVQKKQQQPADGQKQGSKAAAKVNGTGSKAPAKKGQGKKKSSGFAFKAVGALTVFFFSGVFHEWINYICLGEVTGEEMAFFMLHGFATVGQSYIQRTFPVMKTAIPSPVGWAMTITFVILTTPLFCQPFIRAGYMSEAKHIGVLGGLLGGTHWAPHGTVWFLEHPILKKVLPF